MFESPINSFQTNLLNVILRAIENGRPFALVRISAYALTCALVCVLPFVPE